MAPIDPCWHKIVAHPAAVDDICAGLSEGEALAIIEGLSGMNRAMHFVRDPKLNEDSIFFEP
jgi:hypothetical protein